MYDSVSCIVIEMAYQQYVESNGLQKFRYCHFKRGSTIDF